MRPIAFSCERRGQSHRFAAACERHASAATNRRELRPPHPIFEPIASICGRRASAATNRIDLRAPGLGSQTVAMSYQVPSTTLLVISLSSMFDDVEVVNYSM